MVAEEAHQGKDAATLEIVMESASLLMHGQLEGLGAWAKQAHAKVAGLSHPSTSMAVQPPVVVA